MTRTFRIINCNLLEVIHHQTNDHNHLIQTHLHIPSPHQKTETEAASEKLRVKKTLPMDKVQQIETNCDTPLPEHLQTDRV
jgi:hypothetical protein